jgi:acylphosphatase
MAATRVHLVIRGRVQGVFFRGSAEDEATALGLTGWVRNCRDGTVELVAEGEESRIERLVAWCHQGPQGALVTDVDVLRETPTGEFTDFRVVR